MKKLLITGASGFLGWNICRNPPRGWRIAGTYLRHKGLFPGFEYFKLDLTEHNKTWAMLKALKPEAVFHLAAISSTKSCEENPEITKVLNVEASVRLAEMCADQGIRFFFCSSEQVYRGMAEICEEHLTPKPGNEYGRQKLEAEQKIAAVLPEAAIVRIAILYGWANSVNPGFLKQWLNAWLKDLPVTVFYDEKRTFLSATSAAEGFSLLLEQGASGVFNMGGADLLSRYEFACLVKQAFHLENAAIESKSQLEVNFGAFRPPVLNLNLAKIRSLGFMPRHIKEELHALATDKMQAASFPFQIKKS
jgi:dTDP-4-dehydrorhamnose reductase